MNFCYTGSIDKIYGILRSNSGPGKNNSPASSPLDHTPDDRRALRSRVRSAGSKDSVHPKGKDIIQSLHDIGSTVYRPVEGNGKPVAAGQVYEVPAKRNINPTVRSKRTNNDAVHTNIAAIGNIEKNGADLCVIVHKIAATGAYKHVNGHAKRSSLVQNLMRRSNAPAGQVLAQLYPVRIGPYGIARRTKPICTNLYQHL